MAPGGPPPFLVLPIATVPGLAHQVVGVGVVVVVVLAPVARGVLLDVLVDLDARGDRRLKYFCKFSLDLMLDTSVQFERQLISKFSLYLLHDI